MISIILILTSIFFIAVRVLCDRIYELQRQARNTRLEVERLELSLRMMKRAVGKLQDERSEAQ